MPWYDPWDLYTLDWEDDVPEPKKHTSVIDKLRGKPLARRTSTYVKGSERAIKGEAAEAEAREWLRSQFVWAGMGTDWVVVPWSEARKVAFGLGPFDRGDEWEAIENSKNGDLYVYRRGQGLWDEPELLFSIEVKSSDSWPSIAISYSELFDSSASYLMGITTYGTWICTMDEARRAAKLRESYKSSFYTVDPMSVSLLTIKEIIDAEENPRRNAQDLDPAGGDDIPF